MNFELYRAKWRITAWRNGAVYQTEFVEDAWWPDHEVENNRPAESGFTFSPPRYPTTQAERRGIRRVQS